MASAGKKGKKTKGKTLALNDFLQETPGATPTIPIRKTNLNWADDVEDNCDQYESRPKANVILPTAPKASRGFDEFSEKIPQQPPFIAYLSNLPYDVNEDEIADFFRELKISNMRIPKETGESPRLRGFGYVEFEDRESLVRALSITDCTLKNRRIRIEIATNLDNERRRGGRMDSNRDRSDRSEITSGDWRSGPRMDLPELDRSRSSGFNRDRESGSFERDRGSWRDSTDRPVYREERDRDKDRSFRDGYGDRNRFNDRDEKRSFGPRRSDRDDRDFSRGGNRDDGGSEKSEPRMRPKLVLAPRTKPIELTAPETVQDVPADVIPTSVPGSSSIFGNAKPVDTSIRERQIEDRLAKESEKPAASNSNREARRDTDRKDWGRKEDEVKLLSDKRRESPRRYSPRRGSPEYRSDYDRKRDSPVDQSPDRREVLDRRGSPERKGSPDRRRGSPDRRRGSSDRRRASPDYGRGSPDRKWGSPDRKWGSPDRRKGSPDRRKGSPDGRKGSPEYRRGSPDRKNRSPDRSQSNRGSLQRRNDDRDKRGISKNEKLPQKSDKEKHKPLRDNHDREMPKLKEPEPPNFAASNKYAFLNAEGDSD